VVSRLTVVEGRGQGEVRVVVDGDPSYDAGTTRLALSLMLEALHAEFSVVQLEQWTQVPVGHGFGASAASSLSAVYALGRALRLRLPKESLAYFAHEAEIISMTGLGTVSAIYDSVGAGAVSEAGAPGVARFVGVEVPEGIRLVTASLAPIVKRDALSSSKMRLRIRALGDEALSRFLSDPDIVTLAREGERFASSLGLMTPEVEKLVAVAKSRGAIAASQNMIGHAVHALVYEDDAEKVAGSLRDWPSRPRVDVFEIGRRRASPVSFAEVGYPTVTSSFV
jgi:pantoate kinase